jgi:hypothetical protein
MERRKKLLLSLAFVVVVIAVGSVLFAQSVQPAVESSPTVPETPTETPPSLLVVPEVPLGTIAVVLACVLALLIAGMSRKK